MALTRANVAALQNELLGNNEQGSEKEGGEEAEGGTFDASASSVPAKELKFLVALFASCKGEKWRHTEGWESSQGAA
jgi:hypothetical protein